VAPGVGSTPYHHQQSNSCSISPATDLDCQAFARLLGQVGHREVLHKLSNNEEANTSMLSNTITELERARNAYANVTKRMKEPGLDLPPENYTIG
jgi:hypothetical protein